MLLKDNSAKASKSNTPKSLPLLRAPSSKPDYTAIKMKLGGARPWNGITGLEPTGGVSNYFIGNDPKTWRTNVPQYARISVAGVYDGIDLVFYNNHGNLEYDFVVKPGANPNQIQLAFDGQDRMRVDHKSGDLILTTADGSEVRQARPRVYQQVGERQVELASGYELLDHSRATFTLAFYDRRQPLVIDPTIDFVKAINGNNEDAGGPIAVDSAGNVYLAGLTASTDFPVNNESLQWDQPFYDAFVMKLDPNGNILFSTYLGGNSDDGATGIALDNTGVYVTGYTYSTDFPHQNSKKKTDSDVFVTKVFLNGNGIVYTTIVGGTAGDWGEAITVSPTTHNAYVAGNTSSTDFPILVNPNYWHQWQYNGGDTDAFGFELDASGNLLASELMGGSAQEFGEAIAVDTFGGIWISGLTCSANFPVAVAGVTQSYPGKCTGFVDGWTDSFRSLRFARFWGGIGNAIATGSNADAYVAGYATDDSVPTTPGAFQAAFVPHDIGGFISHFNLNGGVLQSTYLGPDDGDAQIHGIATNAKGDVYVSGDTTASDFPGAPYFPVNSQVGAGFFSRFSADLSTLRYSRMVASVENGIAVFDTSPTLPRQIYVAGNVNAVGHGPFDGTQEAVLLTKLTEEMDQDLPGPVPSPRPSAFVRLRNFWKPNLYITDWSGGFVNADTITGDEFAAEWTLILRPVIGGDPIGQNLYWIQNRLNPNEYLNIESGTLKATPIGADWISAHWTIEQVPGTSLYRIHNAWKRSQYLNIENGSLTSGPINLGSGPTDLGWWSALWTLEPVF